MDSLCERDEAKRRLNLAKHGVDFADIVEVFHDPDLVHHPSARHLAEDRWKAVGGLGGAIWSVVYSWRGSTRRLISARRASRNDRRAYYASDSGA